MKYQYAEGCEIDQVIAQWHANLLGLGSVFQPAHLHQALEEIYRQNFKQMRFSTTLAGFTRRTGGGPGDL